MTVAGENGKRHSPGWQILRNEMAGLLYLAGRCVRSRREEVTIELSERALKIRAGAMSTAIRRDSMNVSVGEYEADRRCAA